MPPAPPSITELLCIFVKAEISPRINWNYKACVQQCVQSKKKYKNRKSRGCPPHHLPLQNFFAECGKNACVQFFSEYLRKSRGFPPHQSSFITCLPKSRGCPHHNLELQRLLTTILSTKKTIKIIKAEVSPSTT